MKSMVQVGNLQKTYGQHQAVKGISFTVEEGTLFAFLGTNGAGKSTTIEILCTLLQKTSGTVCVNGYDLDDNNQANIRKSIGVVFQQSLLDSKLSVYENIIHRGKIYGLSKVQLQENYQFVSTYLQLDDIAQKKYSALSGGQKRRADIARALIHRPKILFLDEPTSGLDPVARDEILGELAKYMEDDTNSILISSHITSDLEKIADTITLIEDGAIIFSEDKDVLTSKFGLWSGTALQAESIPPHAITWQRRSAFGVTLLVERKFVSEVFALEKPTIEDLILFHTKGA